LYNIVDEVNFFFEGEPKNSLEDDDRFLKYSLTEDYNIASPNVNLYYRKLNKKINLKEGKNDNFMVIKLQKRPTTIGGINLFDASRDFGKLYELYIWYICQKEIDLL
jgi:hypothetical protein